MLSFNLQQQKLALVVQHFFTKQMFDCRSSADLVAPTKAFIAEVAELVLPET